MTAAPLDPVQLQARAQALEADQAWDALLLLTQQQRPWHGNNPRLSGYLDYLAGRALLEQQQHAQALPLLSAACEVLPEVPFTHNLLGRALAGLQDWQAAAAAQQRCIERKPDFGYAWLELGRACEALGDGPRAGEAYQQAMRLLPDNEWLQQHCYELQVSGRLVATPAQASARSRHAGRRQILPGITLLRWLFHLKDDQYLLVGWSASPYVQIDRQSGVIDGSVDPSHPPQSPDLVQIAALATDVDPCWGFLWRGRLPDGGFVVKHQRQYPQPIDLSELPWPASAIALVSQIAELKISDLDVASCLDLWLGPALAALQPVGSTQPHPIAGTRIVPFAGTIPGHPRYSVVVPLYRRYDMLKAHLLNLAAEREHIHGELELVVVLDDPSLTQQLLEWCSATADLFDLPFVLAIHPDNHGFAQACNSGALLARGRHLVLMNSDVFPISPGWLEPLGSELDGDPNLAVVAPLLLYPDGSLQHAGMESQPSNRWPGIPLNRHPRKGLAWEGGRESCSVPLLSAACWVVKRDLFLAMDGFRTDLIQGDGEDSAFCRRLQHEGFAARLVPSVSMIHVERQSMGGHDRSATPADQLMVLANLWLAGQPTSTTPAT